MYCGNPFKLARNHLFAGVFLVLLLLFLFFPLFFFFWHVYVWENSGGGGECQEKVGEEKIEEQGSGKWRRK